MPNNKKAKPKATYNPEHGGSFMDIEPLDPRQGQPLDLTIPHAMDQTLAPPLKPGQQPTPVIGPPQGTPSDWEANPLILHPGEYLRPAASDLKKT
jgi:hypothetical protein